MSAQPWTQIPAGPHDIKLVVADMDGTLLDEHSKIPEEFWPMLDRMNEQGVTFVPASGRQLATLKSMFGHIAQNGSYIAENGNMVVSHGQVVNVIDIPMEEVHCMLDAARDAYQQGKYDIGVVVCGLDRAYVNRRDDAFLAECRKYYHELEIVDDLYAVQDRVLKVAVFDFDEAEPMAHAVFGGFEQSHQVVVSGKHWVDIMDRDADKKQGVIALQRALGVTPAQTAVFGDYLNDLLMLDTGEWSFAMANAHPDLKRAAHYEAPSNAEHGVLQVLHHLLGV